MSETYKMELTASQVKWLLNKEKTEYLLKEKDNFSQYIETQNSAMQLVIEEVLKLTKYENNSREVILRVGEKTLDHFLIDDEWYDKDEVINHLKFSIK